MNNSEDNEKLSNEKESPPIQENPQHKKKDEKDLSVEGNDPQEEERQMREKMDKAREEIKKQINELLLPESLKKELSRLEEEIDALAQSSRLLLEKNNLRLKEVEELINSSSHFLEKIKEEEPLNISKNNRLLFDKGPELDEQAINKNMQGSGQEPNENAEKGDEIQQKTLCEKINGLMTFSSSQDKKELFKNLVELINQINTFEEIKNVFNHLCQSSQNILNVHRNPLIDRFFGIKNTRHWASTLKVIRDHALSILLKEVEEKADFQEKIDLLNKAKEDLLFNKHRNNFLITGAFGDTAAVRKIQGEIDKITRMQPKKGIVL